MKENESWSLASQQWADKPLPSGQPLPDLHLMIDFETFSTDTENGGIMGAAIVPFVLTGSIPEDAPEAEPFFRWATMESNYIENREMKSSQKWWSEPERLRAWEAYTLATGLGAACHVRNELEPWIMNYVDWFFRPEWDYRHYRDVYVWSRGVFDMEILVNIYKRHGRRCPVPFYRFRDVRTFLSALHFPEAEVLVSGEVIHVPHTDCLNDIRAVRRAYAVLDECGFFSKVGAVSAEANRQQLKSCVVNSRVKLYDAAK
jgi:hypothetical protein